MALFIEDGAFRAVQFAPLYLLLGGLLEHGCTMGSQAGGPATTDGTVESSGNTAGSLGSDDAGGPVRYDLPASSCKGGLPPVGGICVGDHPTDLVAEDVNGDGVDEILISSRNSRDLTMLERGGGLDYREATYSPVALRNDGWIRGLLAPAALTSTERLDLVIVYRSFIPDADPTGTIELRRGGDPFGTTVMHTFEAEPAGSWLATGLRLADDTAAIVSVNFSGDVVLHALEGDTWKEVSRDQRALGLPVSLQAIDLVNDGALEIVVVGDNYDGSSQNGVAVFTLRDREFADLLHSPIAAPAVISGITVLGRDNLTNMVVLEPAAVGILRGSGDGTFSGYEHTAISGSVELSAIATADFDHDGISDVVAVGCEPPILAIVLGKDDGIGSPRVEPFGQCPIAVATSDLNEDGSVDIVIADADADALLFLYGSSDGDFRP